MSCEEWYVLEKGSVELGLIELKYWGNKLVCKWVLNLPYSVRCRLFTLCAFYFVCDF